MNLEEKIKVLELKPISEKNKKEIKPFEKGKNFLFQKEYETITMFFSKEYLEQTPIEELKEKENKNLVLWGLK